ncbi:AAA family ATPase, partial [Actinotalea ferrariae]|uniref:AAA family ATPase n=1 Tax=Actinotalea ferrariae TaxID=1386098 RepID=UPI001C8C4C40
SDPRAGAPGGLADPAALAPADARRLVGLVPQDPTQLLYLETVAAECTAADREAGASPGSTAALLAGLAGTVPPDAHPRDLSEGQRLALVLAVQLAARPRVLLLDEPTRGLDYAAKARLAAALRDHADAGGVVLLSSHDVEFVAEAATRVVVLAAGEVVTDGPAHDVLVASPTFAPQVAKVLHPVELLTVSAVTAALAVTA